MGGEKVLDEFNGINKQSEFGVYADEMNKLSDEFRIEAQSVSGNQKNNKAIKRKKSLLRQALAITMVTVGVVATQNIQSENMYNSEINSILSKTIEYAKNDDCKSLYELYIKQNAYEFVEKYGEDTYAYNQSQRNWVMTETVGDKSKSYDLFFHNEYRGDYRYVVLFIADFSGEEVNGSIDVLVVYNDDRVDLRKGTMEEGKLVGEIEQHEFFSYPTEDGCSRTYEWLTKSQVGGRGIEGKTQIYYSWPVDTNCNIYLDHNGNVDVEKSKQLGTTVTFDEDGVYFGDKMYLGIDKGFTYVDHYYNYFYYDNDDIERLAKAFLSEIDTEE